MLSLFVGLCGLLWLLGIPMPFPFFLLLVAEACCTVAYWRTVFQLRSERDVKLAHSSLLVEVRGGAGRPCSSLTSTSFKKINDSFGHEAGDDALVRFAGLLADLASGGVICRLGGAEFQIALPGQSMAAAVGYGECLQAALRENLAAAGDCPPFTISVGVAATPETATRSQSSAVAPMRRCMPRRPPAATAPAPGRRSAKRRRRNR